MSGKDTRRKSNTEIENETQTVSDSVQVESCTVQLSGAFSVPSSSETEIPLSLANSAQSNRADWSDGNGIRVDRSGWFSVDAGIFTTGNNNRSDIRIYRNTTLRRAFHSPATGDYGWGGSMKVYLEAGDLVTMRSFTFSTGSRPVNTDSANTYLQVTYLGPGVTP